MRRCVRAGATWCSRARAACLANVQTPRRRSPSTTSGKRASTLNAPLFVDPYDTVRTTGSLILIDEATNHTVAAGLVE